MTLATPTASRPPQPPPTPLFRSTPVHSPPARSHPSTAAAAHSPASCGQRKSSLLTPNPSMTAALHDGSNGHTQSPNYFGLSLSSSKDGFSSSAAHHARGHWSPPTSQVRSTAAASPRVIPLDQNPEFDAFRRASEAANNFDFGMLNNFNIATSQVPRLRPHHASSLAPSLSINDMPPPSPKTSPSSGSLSSFNETQKSPKRVLSSPAPDLTDRPRRNSPASFAERPDADQIARFLDDRPPSRMSLPAASGSPPRTSPTRRAETLPLKAVADKTDKTDGVEFVTPQHVVSLLDTLSEDILLLDLRVSTQYSRGRISGALNLCIPTTLLKRPSFNLAKLMDTFKDDEQKYKFQNWSDCKYIIVYDANSAQAKDAVTCVHTLKKFVVEGWSGPCYIIRGGFQEFSKKFPSLIVHAPDRRSGSTSSSASDSECALPRVAPVAGGCPMPVTQNAANPFFGNIRQNMDLIGGVGQMPIKKPSGMTTQLVAQLPFWLKQASEDSDNGGLVSEKFLQIERREQRRMQEALSDTVTYGTPGPNVHRKVQIAGIEKGTKNRYNNIWPYEHSRVRLQGVSHGGCDYINANHVKSRWSNKRYVATQGPIPTTFTDFWNVVWQQDIRVIVMLTAEKEGGQLKAHNYWESRSYGPLKLHYLSEHRASLEPEKIHRHKGRPSGPRRSGTSSSTQSSQPEAITSPSADQPYVIVRRFTLAHADHPFERMREITQLQYSHWPDFGAPAHPAHLLGLVEQCDAVVRASMHNHTSAPDPPESRPVLVHCSAGCGRTGTFCTVDTVIDLLKRQRSSKNISRKTKEDNSHTNELPDCEDVSWVEQDDTDLIEKTVEDFRLQRLSMVQSLRQFVLCYESVLEWLQEQQPKAA